MQHLQKTRGWGYSSQFGKVCAVTATRTRISFKFFLFTLLRTLFVGAPYAGLACGGFDSSFIFFSPDYPLSRPTSAKLPVVLQPTSLTPAAPRLPHHSSCAVPSVVLKTRPAIRKNPNHLK